MNATLFLKIEARFDELERAITTIEDFAQAQGWSRRLILKLRLILEEIGTNIISYGCPCSEIEIKVSSGVRVITVDIIDDAPAFNPLKDAPPPDLQSTLANRTVGGLGVHIARSIANEMRYRRESGRNHLTLTKHRKEE